MLLVGELLNASRPAVARAIASHDEEYVLRVAKRQVRAGAAMLDVNAGMPGGDEARDLCWMIQLIQREIDIPLMIDSSHPASIEVALSVHRGRPVVNSISGEHNKLNALLPVISAAGCGVVVLCLGEAGIPGTPAGRLSVAREVVERLGERGVEPADIYVDPLALTVATERSGATVVLETARMLKQELPLVHTMCGVSNVGFGLPRRKLLNRIMASLLTACGADALLLDVTDEILMAELKAALVLTGRDPLARGYLQAYREGLLGA